MKDIILKLPPCTNQPPNCRYRIVEAIRTEIPYQPGWDAFGNLVEDDPNETVGILECATCLKRFEYRYKTDPAAATVKATIDNPAEFPDQFESRPAKFARLDAAFKAGKAQFEEAKQASVTLP